jgi:hypothetical protein
MRFDATRASACAVLTAVAFVLSTAANDVRAERIEQTSAKSNPRIVSRNVVTLNDVAGHEVGQEMQISTIKFSHSSFRAKEEWVYNQFDFVNGSGPHRGTWVDWHEDGSQTFGTYEGSQKTVANPDGSWSATWEGTYKYTGGTGKYKNIKGTGTYKGKATSAGEFSEDGKETMQY